MSRSRPTSPDSQRPAQPEPVGWLIRACVLAAAGMALSGCASSLNTIGDPSATGSLSAAEQSAQQDSATPQIMAFPAIHDVPPPRAAATLNDYEQKRMENELIAARNRLGKPWAQKSQSQGQAQGSGDAAPQKTGAGGGT